MNSIAPGPVYVVVWEAFHAPALSGEGPWNRLSRTFSLELDAVHHWDAMRLYENTRPVAITPEPDWSRYTYGK